MEFTPQRFREYFPATKSGIFFDNAGGTQTPQPVAEAIAAALMSGLSQRGTTYSAARTADAIVRDARAALGDFLNTDPGGVIFGRSATSLLFDLARTLTSTLRPGDEILVSRIDHDANIRPWIFAAEAAGANVRWIDFDPITADVNVEHVEAVISDRTKIVALTAGSNLFGTIPPISEISKLVRRVGALLVVDAVASAPHVLPDVRAFGADFLVCSTYKFFGPHLGVLAADPVRLQGLHPQKLLPSPESVPERFELGTLPYELLAGATATVDFLAGFSHAQTRRERLAEFYREAGRYEAGLANRIITGLSQIPGVRRLGAPRESTPTVLFTVDNYAPAEIGEFLGAREIGVSVGDFYARAATAWSNLGPGGIRLSLAPYNTEAEVTELLRSLRAAVSR